MSHIDDKSAWNLDIGRLKQGHKATCAMHHGLAVCDCGLFWEQAERAAFNPRPHDSPPTGLGLDAQLPPETRDLRASWEAFASPHEQRGEGTACVLCGLLREQCAGHAPTASSVTDARSGMLDVLRRMRESIAELERLLERSR